MKKLFISQPMKGKTKEEILRNREIAIRKARDILGEDIKILETYFSGFMKNPKPLNYIAKSIEYLAEADVVYFADGWDVSRGCKIEHQCAVEYGVKRIYS